MRSITVHLRLADGLNTFELPHSIEGNITEVSILAAVYHDATPVSGVDAPSVVELHFSDEFPICEFISASKYDTSDHAYKLTMSSPENIVIPVQETSKNYPLHLWSNGWFPQRFSITTYLFNATGVLDLWFELLMRQY
jgi:hypothetical protein